MNAAAQKKIVANKVLVTGASGLLGVAAIEKFLSAGWEVVGVSRRKPKLPSGRDVRFLPVDLRDEDAARAAFEPLADVTHIAYTALHEKPELVAGWSSKEQIETNTAMLRNVVEPIVRTASNFQHISIYAAIRREKGEPFGFPGGPSFVWEAADAGLVADAMVWAAQSPQAANEAFNITSGDVFEWRNVWPALAETLGVEPGPDMPASAEPTSRKTRMSGARSLRNASFARGTCESWLAKGTSMRILPSPMAPRKDLGPS
jgi:nucleoside-diphosphate-sugar epimerase